MHLKSILNRVERLLASEAYGEKWARPVSLRDD